MRSITGGGTTSCSIEQKSPPSHHLYDQRTEYCFLTENGFRRNEVPMLRANGRRLWRCRIYTLLILVLTGVALLITWKHLPDEQNFGKRFRSTIKQTTSATGSNYFDTRQPVEKVSVQQVTLVHAERSYPKKNGTDSDNSESASSPLSSPSTPTTPISPPATVSASLSPAESTAAPSSTAFPSPDESVVPSAELTELSSAEQKLAKRKALIETSKKVRKTILA